MTTYLYDNTVLSPKVSIMKTKTLLTTTSHVTHKNRHSTYMVLASERSEPSTYIVLASERSEPSTYMVLASERSEPSTYIVLASERSEPSQTLNV